MARMQALELARGREIPPRYLRARYSRSSGAGGQNVNKVATKVDLRLDLDAAGEALEPAEVARIRAKLATRIDARGRLFVVCDEHRDRARNLQSAHARMQRLLRAALARRRPRKATKPTRASRRKRVDAKTRRGALKRSRRGVSRDD